MTHKKTESFNSISPLKLDDKTSRTDERSNLQADWKRYGTLSPRINGTPLTDYLSKYNNFETEADIKRFFKEVLLANTQLETGEDQAIQYLLKYFRQKGFMQPVTITLERSLLLGSLATPYEYLLSSNFLEQQIDIRTTDKGFSIQEFTIVTKLNKTERASGNTTKLGTIDTMPFLIKAEGTLDFDFTQNPSDPKLTIKSNFISYGHPEVKSLMSKRSLLEWLVEFIGQLLGKKPPEHKVELSDYSEPHKEEPSSDPGHHHGM